MLGMFTSIGQPFWDDKPCLIVGGGPSLKEWDIRDLRAFGRVVALNDTMRYIQCDVVFSMDTNWIKRSESLVAGFEGEEVWIATHKYVKPYTVSMKTPVRYVEKCNEKGLSRRRDSVNTQGTSGYGVMSLAFWKRAKLIYLLGYDMKKGFHQQWHDSEKILGLPRRRDNQHYYNQWGGRFSRMVRVLKEAGVRVVNLNPDSAVTCFEFSSYEEFGLRKLKEIGCESRTSDSSY